MRLIALIKSSASASATVPASQSQDGHSRVDERRQNKIAPWQTGRRPPSRKETDAGRFCASSSGGKCSSDLAARWGRAFARAKLKKSAIYRWSNYTGMGGTPNPMKQVYNNLVHTGLSMTPGGDTMGSAVSAGIAGSGYRRPSVTRESDYDRATSWKGLFADPGRFADAVYDKYQQQSTGEKLLGNVGSGFEVGSFLLPGGGIAGAGLKGVARGMLPSVVSDSIGARLSGDGPSTVDKLLSPAATLFGIANDRSYVRNLDRGNFRKLLDKGLPDVAARFYPKLWADYQGSASPAYALGRSAGSAT